jgi:hypothetical protein
MQLGHVEAGGEPADALVDAVPAISIWRMASK